MLRVSVAILEYKHWIYSEFNAEPYLNYSGLVLLVYLVLIGVSNYSLILERLCVLSKLLDNLWEGECR